MNYSIAIPSLGRCDILKKMTLASLQYHGMLPSRITVFVVEEEYEEYRAALPDTIKVVVGVRGIIQQLLLNSVHELVSNVTLDRSHHYILSTKIISK